MQYQTTYKKSKYADNSHKKKVDDLKADCRKQAERCDTMQIDIYKVSNSLLTITDKIEYLEGQTRGNNQSHLEKPGPRQRENHKNPGGETTTAAQDGRMERAHHTGKPDGGDGPRPIVVKLLRYKDIEAILQRAKSLRGTKIYIEDFTDAVRQKRKDLMSELKAARQRGDIAYLH